jgi:tetratricopeptide (TPR) repeat protein
MFNRFIFLPLALCSAAWCSEFNTCRPTPEIEEELRKAAAVPIAEPFACFKNVAPFQEVRERHSDDLFAHEAYQDAMHEHGIEGHMRYLTKEYDALKQKHPSELMFEYLALRTLVGRETPTAIESLNQLLSQHPDFAPAHRTLAEIYGTETFREAEKEKIERAKYLNLCPGGAFTKRPPGIPKPSTLIDEAERRFAQGADPAQVLKTAMQGQTEYEWRTQRIRAFDWYTRDYRLQDAQYLRNKNWQALTIRVRACWKAERAQEALATIGQMKRMLPGFLQDSDAMYWQALDTLVQLYSEGKQKESAINVLSTMRKFAAEKPSSEWSARIEALVKLASMEGSVP